MAAKRVLIVLSEWGYWGEELIGPLETFDVAGYESTFITPAGLRPIAYPVSMDPTFVDPPLGKIVVSQDMADKVRRIDDPKNPRLSAPMNLAQWFPENPYPSAPDYLRRRERYFNALDERKNEIRDRFDTILVVGGGGATIDLANNYRVHDLIRCFYELGKPVAAECYGVTCLAFTYTSEDDNRPIIWGKHVTGHPRPFDYEIGTSIWWRDMRDEKGQKVGGYLTTEFPTIPLQLVLECAVGPVGRFHGNVGREISVIVDYPFITGRTTPDSYMVGQQLKNVLEDPNYRRYGW